MNREGQPRPRGQGEQMTAGRGPDPRFPPYLPHVGRQLGPGVVVPDVELHVYVHDAGSPAGSGRDRSWNDASRLPALGLSGSPREAPRLTLRRAGAAPWPGLPTGPRCRATGHRSSGDTGRSASAAPSFFLVSARRKRLWARVTSALRREPGGAGPRLASYPAPRV